MGKQIPMGGIKTAMKLDPGNWRGTIEDVSDDEPTQGGHYRIRAVIRTTEPVAGLVHYENFNVGTDDDPQADDPATWTERELNGAFNTGFASASRFKRMMLAAGCPSAEEESIDIDALKQEAPGRPIDFVIVHKLPKGADGQPDETANPFVNIQSVYAEGTITPGIAGPSAKPAATKPAMGQRAMAARPQQGPVARPVAPTRPAPAPARPPIQRTISRPQAVEMEEPEGALPPATKRGA